VFRNFPKTRLTNDFIAAFAAAGINDSDQASKIVELIDE
jgi:hypothetical protein